MWDILLYNFAAYRGSTTLSQVGGLFDEELSFPVDSSEEGEDIIEMDKFHYPNIEVILSNGQALPPQSGRQRRRAEQASQEPRGMDFSTPTSGMPELDPTAQGPWPMSLDMAYDPFYQFQPPGSPFLGTWEVGNL